MSAADLDSMNESGIDPEEDSSWESEDNEMAPDYDRIVNDEFDNEEYEDAQEDADDTMADDVDEEAEDDEEDDGKSTSGDCLRKLTAAR
jgi:hypothetical protein